MESRLVLLCFLLYSVQGNNIKIFQTAKFTNDRLTPQVPISFSQGSQDPIRLVVNETARFQKIMGFGGAFTESSGYVLSLMKDELQSQLIDAFFGNQGNRYTLGRVHINSCDFSLSSYSYDDVIGDIALDHFDISHDDRFMIPFVKRAIKSSQSPVKIYASPWSPPAWMKSNDKMTGSGIPCLKSDPAIYKSWALYFAKFIQAYQNTGIDIWGITVQNEPGWSPPWEGCYYNASLERDFVREHLGPTLRHFYPDVKILICDDQKSGVLDWAKTILSDKEASQYVWGTGFHWYDGDHFDHLESVHDLFPDKNLLATEATDCPAILGNWDSGENYGHDIIGDLNHWAIGWVHWNMFLNMSGGPNHLDNNCDAPILADPINQILYYQPSYFYMGHFSRFIPPDSVRIGIQLSSNDLESVAFLTPQDEIVVVLMNRANSTLEYRIEDLEYHVRHSIPGHAIQTLIYPKLKN